MQATKKGIPPGARWTKIDRRLVNPETLEEAKERFEERLDCVIVLRVLTKEEIQKFADRTKAIRGKRSHFFSSASSDAPNPCDPPKQDPVYAATAIELSGTRFASPLLTFEEKKQQKLRRKLRRRPWTFHGARAFHFPNILKHSLTHHSYHADERYDEERAERKAARRKDKHRDRHERDEYSDDSEDEYAEKQPMMLEAPSDPGAQADFIKEGRERRRDRDAERETQYMSGGLGRRE